MGNTMILNPTTVLFDVEDEVMAVEDRLVYRRPTPQAQAHVYAVCCSLRLLSGHLVSQSIRAANGVVKALVEDGAKDVVENVVSVLEIDYLWIFVVYSYRCLLVM
jgi:hypothetical protein